ncbi:ABC transporter substrate-binding protein [Kaistia granuli]|uniref:ABC transporter substrate-binding protein n=1 Tax=Kaistia granuli TaxID=363259 RepID=UPI000380F9CE|nr:ABC transporter substrate-binding protein [Kaistia granuli]
MNSLLDLRSTLRRTALASVSAFGLLMAAAAGASAAEIVVAIGAEPTTLDPQAQDDGPERLVNDNLYETLYVRDAEGNLKPGLAEALPKQIDPLTWEIVVRDGVKFHNGEPLDAKAVAFSLKRIVDPALKSGQFSYVSTIKDAVAVDARTVRVTTEKPDPALTARLYWLKIVPPAYASDPNFAAHPIGSGPFKFERWDRGEEVVLKANPDYWGEKPKVDEVTFRFIPDASTRLAGLMSGEVDLINNVAPEFVPQLPKVAKVEGLELPYIVLNAREGSPIADARVRQALLYAINREELAEGLFEGNASVASGQLAVPTAFGFNDAVKPYPYDPEKAKALLKEAGAEGLTINVVGPGGRFLKDRDTVEAVAAYWTALGLDVKVRIPEWSDYLATIFNKDVRPDIYYSSSANELFDVDRAITAYYHPSSPGASNADAELAEWIDTARFETDVDKRKALYAKITERSFDKAYVNSILRVQDIYGLSERIDWKPRVDGKLFIQDVVVTE